MNRRSFLAGAAGCLALPSLVAAQARPFIWEFPAGVTPPASLAVTLSGVGSLSGAYTLPYVEHPDPRVAKAERAAFGYTWIHPILSLTSPASQLRVAYSGGGFPGTMFVSICDKGGFLLAQFSGSAPHATPTTWNVTLPGLVAGSANVRA